jgi:hypothetical protein
MYKLCVYIFFLAQQYKINVKLIECIKKRGFSESA